MIKIEVKKKRIILTHDYFEVHVLFRVLAWDSTGLYRKVKVTHIKELKKPNRDYLRKKYGGYCSDFDYWYSMKEIKKVALNERFSGKRELAGLFEHYLYSFDRHINYYREEKKRKALKRR